MTTINDQRPPEARPETPPSPSNPERLDDPNARSEGQSLATNQPLRQMRRQSETLAASDGDSVRHADGWLRVPGKAAINLSNVTMIQKNDDGTVSLFSLGAEPFTIEDAALAAQAAKLLL